MEIIRDIVQFGIVGLLAAAGFLAFLGGLPSEITNPIFRILGYED